MKKLIYTLAFFSATIFTFAQQTSNLIVFSEDGLPFYLILNGIRQNVKAETNMKVDGLNQPYYSAKIIFEDKSQPILEKKVLQIQSVDASGPMEITYKIKKNNKNVNVLRYFSETPIAQVIEQPQNVTVVHYNTTPMPEITQVVVMEQTSTTTTTHTNDNVNVNMGVGMGMPGINMNVNINEPSVVQETTNTTIITTTSSHQHQGHNNHNNHNDNDDNYSNQQPKGCNGNRAMNSSNFSAAKQTISNQKFDDTKLSTATQIINSNCLSAQQIKEIMLIFTFEDTRLKLAKDAHSKCIDPNNYFLLNDAFKFSSSVEELNNAVK